MSGWFDPIWNYLVGPPVDVAVTATSMGGPGDIIYYRPLPRVINLHDWRRSKHGWSDKPVGRFPVWLVSRGYKEWSGL